MNKYTLYRNGSLLLPAYIYIASLDENQKMILCNGEMSFF